MTEASYPGYRGVVDEDGARTSFAPKVLQDVALERTMVQTVAAGLGVALVPSS